MRPKGDIIKEVQQRFRVRDDRPSQALLDLLHQFLLVPGQLLDGEN